MIRRKGELRPAGIDRGWTHQVALRAIACEGGGYKAGRESLQSRSQAYGVVTAPATGLASVRVFACKACFIAIQSVNRHAQHTGDAHQTAPRRAVRRVHVFLHLLKRYADASPSAVCDSPFSIR